MYQSSRFNAYQTFCAGHREAVDLIRKVSHQHLAEWDAYEQRCSAMAADMEDQKTAESEPDASASLSPTKPLQDRARTVSLTSVDGTAAPGGGTDAMRASYGTTKYCMAFLRGVSCSDHSCMNLHEWGDEKDCFTKEDLTTLYAPFPAVLCLPPLTTYGCGIGNTRLRIQRSRVRQSSSARRTTHQVRVL